MELLTLKIEIIEGQYVVTSPEYPDVKAHSLHLFDALRGFIFVTGRDIIKKIPSKLRERNTHV